MKALKTGRGGGRATGINSELHSVLSRLVPVQNSPLSELFPLSTSIEWEGQPHNLWPIPDVAGWLAPGVLFIIEIDDQADPCRSLVKYWPLLKRVGEGDFQVRKLAYLGITSPNSTFGQGYQDLTIFCGQEFTRLFGERLSFSKLVLRDTTGALRSASELAFEAMPFFGSVVAGSATAAGPKP